METKSQTSLVDVRTNNGASVNVDGIFSLNRNNADAEGSLVSVNTASDGQPSSNSEKDTRRTQVNIPGIFSLDIGGPRNNDNRPGNALVSVRTGASGTRVRAPFVDVSV